MEFLKSCWSSSSQGVALLPLPTTLLYLSKKIDVDVNFSLSFLLPPHHKLGRTLRCRSAPAARATPSQSIFRFTQESPSFIYVIPTVMDVSNTFWGRLLPWVDKFQLSSARQPLLWPLYSSLRGHKCKVSVVNDQAFVWKKVMGLNAIKVDGPWANVRRSPPCVAVAR